MNELEFPSQSASATYAAAKHSLDNALADYEQGLRAAVAPVIGDHYITGRVKTARSLIRKLRKDPSNPREWESITDKVGLRVICSTKRDCKLADKAIILQGWTVLERQMKTGRHDRMFYPGIHFIVSNGTSFDHLGNPIPCEIQIRTRAQDAWSVVSHKLLYKGVIKPPKKMMRVITRLTVVAEMFDDEVHRMIKRREHLPMYEAAVALELLDDKFEEIVGEPSDGAMDLDIMNVILTAYTPEERSRFAEIVADFCSERADEIRQQIEAHQPGVAGYVEARDWLFTQPEIISILERGRARESMLAHAVADTELEESVRKACSAIGIVLPRA